MSNQNKQVIKVEKTDLRYSSIIPADRVYVNGHQSRFMACVTWVLRDVYSFETRSPQVLSIKSSLVELDADWGVFIEGHGSVPLKIIFNDLSKTAVVIF